MLQESEIQFEIVQEYSPTGKERICLGNVRLNLAEYVTSGAAAGAAAGGGEEEIQGTLGGHTTGAPAGGAAAGATVGSNAHAAAGVDAAAATEPLGVVRRYLLQDSKINSTLKVRVPLQPLLSPSLSPFSRFQSKDRWLIPLSHNLKIGIHMSQTEGDRSFRAPQLRTAPVFGGLAGILSSEAGAGDGDDGSNMPSMSSKAQESGKLQDLYRRNLCASWAAQHGELAADKCIEDLFAGGDGWARLGDAAAPTSQASAGSTARVGTANQGSTEEDSENERRGSTNSIIRGHHKRHSSGSTLKGPGRNTVTSSSGPGAVPGRASLEHQVQESHEGKRHGTIGRNEVDEFSLREDLRSWEISAKG